MTAEPLSPNGEKTEHNAPPEAEKQTDTAENQIPPTSAKPQANESPHCREITCNAKRDCIDWATIALEAFGLTVLIVYTIYTAKMYCANRDAANAATSAASTAARQLELTSRPWVDINVSITSPLIYDSNGMHIGFTFIPNNIGQSPAQNVSIIPRLVPALMGDDLSEKQRSICRNSAAQDQDADLKYVLFPGHNYSQQIGLGMSREEINSRWSKFDLSRGPIDLIPIAGKGNPSAFRD